MKKKIKLPIRDIRDRIDDKLRYLCALLSPENRLIVIIILLLAGTLLNFYFMFSTLNNRNRKDKADIPIENLSKNLNNQYYEQKEFDEEVE